MDNFWSKHLKNLSIVNTIWYWIMLIFTCYTWQFQWHNLGTSRIVRFRVRPFALFTVGIPWGHEMQSILFLWCSYDLFQNICGLERRSMLVNSNKWLENFESISLSLRTRLWRSWETVRPNMDIGYTSWPSISYCTTYMTKRKKSDPILPKVL